MANKRPTVGQQITNSWLTDDRQLADSWPTDDQQLDDRQVFLGNCSSLLPILRGGGGGGSEIIKEITVYHIVPEIFIPTLWKVTGNSGVSKPNFKGKHEQNCDL